MESEPQIPQDLASLDGVRWTRDEVAEYWSCSPRSVAKLSERHKFPRVGFDDRTGQGTYLAAQVVAAKRAAPGQGHRSDLGDRESADQGLEATQNPYYLLGRVLAAAALVNGKWPNAPRVPAAERFLTEADARANPALFERLEREWRAAHDEPLLADTTRADEVWAELLPKVRHLDGPQGVVERSMLELGFHRQHEALIS